MRPRNIAGGVVRIALTIPRSKLSAIISEAKANGMRMQSCGKKSRAAITRTELVAISPGMLGCQEVSETYRLSAAPATKPPKPLIIPSRVTLAPVLSCSASRSIIMIARLEKAIKRQVLAFEIRISIKANKGKIVYAKSSTLRLHVTIFQIPRGCYVLP
jgi:hypothetical protein